MPPSTFWVTSGGSLLFTSSIFWDVRDLGDPHKADLVLVLTPLAFELDAYRQVLMNKIAPDMFHLTVIGLLAGAFIFMMVILMRRNRQFFCTKGVTA